MNQSLIILCIFILVFLVLFFFGYLKTWMDDLWYLLYFRVQNRWEPFINQNQLEQPDQKLVKICFLTLETRGETEDYVKLHNQSFREYVEYQNRKNRNVYTYRFITACDSDIPHHHNVYWCKFFSLYKLLQKGDYDYVVWVDSDTVIANYNVDFAQVLKSFQSDCFAAMDDQFAVDLPHLTLNAGVVVFKHSQMGKNILKTMLDIYTEKSFQNKCVNKKGKLNGIWTQSCYEQGVMNWVLYKYYLKNLTVLPNTYIRNGVKCEGDFIIHLYDSPAEKRKRCFQLNLENAN